MGAEQVDAIVIGAGLAGSATAWALTRRGRSVVVLEAFGPGHRRGSSHGSARIFRRAYPDPLYVRLTGEAERLWRQLADETGEELVLRTGGLDYGPVREAEKMYDILRAHGVTAELMAAEAAAERWPGVVFGSEPVLFHPDAGVVDPERAMAAMRRLAVAAGAKIIYETAVVRVSDTPGGAVVETVDASWRAPVAIVAAGPWLDPLLGGLVRLPELAVTQQQAFHFAPVTPAWNGAPPPPVFVRYGETVTYGLLAGRDGEVPGAIKIAEHGPAKVTTGDGRDGIVDPAVRDRIRAFVRDELTGLDPSPVGELTCLYTSTPSEDFILDRQGPFVICSACSGHGAKFAPLTGEIAAGLACGGASPEQRFTLAAHLR
ncbi:MAG TPA: FAD-dependent oxidoreductase [Streptosporangiaceae bacterium]